MEKVGKKGDLRDLVAKYFGRIKEKEDVEGDYDEAVAKIQLTIKDDWRDHKLRSNMSKFKGYSSNRLNITISSFQKIRIYIRFYY